MANNNPMIQIQSFYGDNGVRLVPVDTSISTKFKAINSFGYSAQEVKDAGPRPMPALAARSVTKWECRGCGQPNARHGQPCEYCGATN